MKTLNKLKPYKTDTPENTIKRIKDILENVGIFTIEEYYNHDDEGFFSCQVSIYQDTLRGLKEQYLKTNGKGTSIKYALASAYGELMERIQSSFLFQNYKYALLEKNNDSFRQKLTQEKINVDFFFSPEEKMITIQELLESNGEIVTELLKTDNKEETTTLLRNYFPDNEILCDTYYNVKKEKIVYLPITLMQYACGTNGMCAGNTPSEAIIQGICEIFERYALKQIMFHNITPPVIPDSVFADTDVYKKINTIKSLKNINITIYDCSLGMNLPVIGVLFTDKTNLRYIFHLGADPNPITALERSISEIYQGDENLKYNDYHIHRNVYVNKSLPELTVKKIFHVKCISSGAGYYPNSLFYSKPTYEFNGFNYTGGSSDAEDLKYLKDLIFNLNHELYIKDVGYLGFPSYLIYIPGLSENIRHDKEDMNFHLSFAKYYKTLLNLKETTKEELIQLADTFDMYYDFFMPIKAYYGNIILHNSSKELKKLSLDVVLALINYKIGRYEQSLKYFNVFTKGVDIHERVKYRYIFCLRDMVFLKSENKEGAEIKLILERLYGHEITDFVLTKFYNPENVFANLQLPSCFNCNKCLISNDCKYFEVLKIINHLQDEYKKNIPEQLTLKQIFK